MLTFNSINELFHTQLLTSLIYQFECLYRLPVQGLDTPSHKEVFLYFHYFYIVDSIWKHKIEGRHKGLCSKHKC